MEPFGKFLRLTGENRKKKHSAADVQHVVRGTMQLRAVLVDHESVSRERIKALLCAEPDVKVIAECANGAAALEAINRLNPDLAFLELDIPDVHGIAVLQQAQERKSLRCVVTTADQQYQEQAFQACAFDYLLKPFSQQQLLNTLNRVRQQNQFESEHKAQGHRHLHPVKFRSRGKVVFLRTNEISYIQVGHNDLRIYTTIEVHTCRESFAEFSRRLDIANFLRIDAKTIVNRALVDKVQPDGFGRLLKLTLKTGITLPVSVGYRQFIEQAGLAV